MARLAWRFPLAAIVALAVPAWAAPDPDSDPLQSPACVHARTELDAAMAAPDARGSARLQRARRDALALCLGRETGRRKPSGAPYPAQAVPPIAAAPRLALPPPPPSPAPPPVTVPRPITITTCDPGGCWDSDGRRLNRAAPGTLWGPRGACLRQGGLVTCP